MAYKKTVYKNNEQPALSGTNINKLDEGIENNTICKVAEALGNSSYEVKIDNWETKPDSILFIRFELAKDANTIATLKINNENTFNLVDDDNVLGKDIQGKMFLLRFNGEYFEIYHQKRNANIDLIYPIGSVYFSINNINPATIFGGTWVSFGAGRVPVGVDTTQSEFNAVEKTGGTKTHTLTISEMPKHNHPLGTFPYGTEQWVNPYILPPYQVRQQRTTTMYTDETGGNQAHPNIQPYITCYMWKRTA